MLLQRNSLLRPTSRTPLFAAARGPSELLSVSAALEAAASSSWLERGAWEARGALRFRRRDREVYHRPLA
jgi:hypothetical protein